MLEREKHPFRLFAISHRLRALGTSRESVTKFALRRFPAVRGRHGQTIATLIFLGALLVATFTPGFAMSAQADPSAAAVTSGVATSLTELRSPEQQDSTAGDNSASSEENDIVTQTPADSTPGADIVASSALVVNASVDKQHARPGDTLQYTLQFAGGNGSVLLTNASLINPVPAGATYVASSANAAGGLVGDQVIWTLGSNTPAVPGTGVSSEAQTQGAALRATMTATAPLVSSKSPVTVSLTLSASLSIANVVPTAPVVSGSNGASATLLSGPTPASSIVGPNGVTFVWVYKVQSSGAIGQLTFSSGATSGQTAWPTARSNSVIVAPPLTFRATVNDAVTTKDIQNTAFLYDQSGILGVGFVRTTLYSEVSGRVWTDLDGDGVYDGSEAALPNVTVVIERTNGVTVTTETGDDGAYRFSQLTDTQYTVTLKEETLPSGPTFASTNYPIELTLSTRQQVDNADVGIVPDSTVIGDVVWYDSDGDGVQDVDEPGIGNVSVKLYLDDDGDDQFNPTIDYLVDSAVTDVGGAYRLDALATGNYFVDVNDEHGVLASHFHTIGPQSVNEPSLLTPVALGAVNRSLDFGYVRVPAAGNGIIGDQLWLDSNGDGLYDEQEAVLIGIDVCATPVNGGTVICNKTDINGRYAIEAPEGNYTVAPVITPFGLSATTPAVRSIVLLAGEQRLSFDFGYTGSSASLATVGGSIWQDVPINDVWDGIYDAANEPAISDVSVDLILDSDLDGQRDANEPVVATVSGFGGDYSFGPLLPGRYLVDVSDTYLTLRRFAHTFLGPNPNANNNNHPIPYVVDLSAGEVDLTVDFGYREYEVVGASQSEPGIIGSQIWLDGNRDGVFNPASNDMPISGVTVSIFDGATALASATSGPTGNYLFTNLPLGEYTVRVTDQFKVLELFEPSVTGPQPGHDNNSQIQPYTVILGFSTTTDYTADFGYVRLPTSTLGDCNADQNVNAGDLSALVLEIFDADGNQPADVGQQGFIGDPLGCNPNQDTAVDAGDLSCLVLILFDGADACGLYANVQSQQVAAPTGNNESIAMPSLVIPQKVAVQANSTVNMPVIFNGGSVAIGTLAFSIDYDEKWLDFDPIDANADGVPDNITPSLPNVFKAGALFDVTDRDGELDIIVSQLSLPLRTLPAQTVFTVRFNAKDAPHNTEAAVRLSSAPAASFGNIHGRAATGITSDGSVLITAADATKPTNVFLPLVTR
jgi:uncharacterized repeat protein (TIGR01451 family)